MKNIDLRRMLEAYPDDMPVGVQYRVRDMPADYDLTVPVLGLRIEKQAYSNKPFIVLKATLKEG